jgi:hypothetical protein
MMRYARYAAAVLFALLAAGFVTLWVHSHQLHDVVSGPVGSIQISAASNRGTVVFCVASWQWKSPWSAHALPVSVSPGGYASETYAGFGLRRVYDGTIIRLYLPHWFLAASSLALAALFAFNRTWRYSLRTILVATTFLAAALGLAVYAV